MNDEELARLAREEILRETHRASARAEQVGPQGWKKCPVLTTNKRFLRNTLMSALPRPPKRSHESSRREQTDRRHSVAIKTEKRPGDESNRQSKKEERLAERTRPSHATNKTISSKCNCICSERYTTGRLGCSSCKQTVTKLSSSKNCNGRHKRAKQCLQ